jgi:hypothetical protein
LIGPGYDLALKASGRSVGFATEATAAVLNDPALQTFVVDLLAGAGTLVYDYAEKYAQRQEEIKLGPYKSPAFKLG